MSANPYPSNVSSPHPPPSPELDAAFYCHVSTPSSFILSGFYIANILVLLPLCIFILNHGLKRWHQKGPTSPAASHSDCFTYHLVTMELINVLNCVCYCCGIYRSDFDLILVCTFFTSLIWHGQTFFHMLTCLEHYIAVVHPITYLSLRQDKGIQMRNITIGCVWLLSVVGMGLMALKTFLAILDICLLLINIGIISICSLFVLRVLIHPGPGEQSGGRCGSDGAKQRAFYTIVNILGVLVLRFIGSLIWTLVDVMRTFPFCPMLTVGVWLSLPSSLVLPLLFLHREGKLICRGNKQ